MIEPISFPVVGIYPKGWGSERWVINNDKYCLKILSFKAGHSFSDHYHLLKSETWLLTRGTLDFFWYDLATAERLRRVIVPGDIIDIPAGNPHQLTAMTDAEVIEVSTTHYEEDSYRIGKGSSQVKPNADLKI